jgi:hypothetical protein
MFSRASMERVDRNAVRLTEIVGKKKLAGLQARQAAALIAAGRNERRLTAEANAALRRKASRS